MFAIVFLAIALCCLGENTVVPVTSATEPSLAKNVTQKNVSTAARAACFIKYGSISFASINRRQPPPVLLSFPGSGNTWTRSLIEYATGYFSGSIDNNDVELQASFPGEIYCSRNNSIIKAHPVDLLLNPDRQTLGFHVVSGIRRKDSLRLQRQKEKCNNGSIQSFTHVVFISRDPYPSIFSDYQRDATKSHVGAIGVTPGVTAIVTKRWRFHAMQLSKVYEEKWYSLLKPVLETFGSDRVIAIKYEDLLNRQKRIATLDKIIRFMNYTATRERLECAFTLAERPDVSHRKSKLSASEGYSCVHGLVCDVWTDVIGFSTHFGYGIWANQSCPFTHCEVQYSDLKYLPRPDESSNAIVTFRASTLAANTAAISTTATNSVAATATPPTASKKIDAATINSPTKDYTLHKSNESIMIMNGMLQPPLLISPLGSGDEGLLSLLEYATGTFVSWIAAAGGLEAVACLFFIFTVPLYFL